MPITKEAVLVELVIEGRTLGTWSVLAVSGELDLATAPALRERVGEIGPDGPPKVALDFTGVGFVDSSGLGVLVGALKRLREAGGDDVVLLGVQEPVRKVFEITGLDRLFRLEG